MQQRLLMKIVLVAGTFLIIIIGGICAFALTDAHTIALVLGFTCNTVLFIFYASPVLLLVRIPRIIPLKLTKP